LKGYEMTTSAKQIRFDENSMWVELADGRTIGVPLAWFPRLLHALPEQRQKVEISPRGLHWDELDEDISIDGLLAGHGDMTRAGRIAA
jgi:hypothetical protein